MNLQIQPTKLPSRRKPSAMLTPKGKIVTKAFNLPVILHTLCEDGGMSAQYDGDVRRLRERVQVPTRMAQREEMAVAETSIYWG